MKRSIILIFAFLLSLSSYSQSQLSQEDAFIYFMKANGHKKGDNTQNRSRGFGNYKWFDIYVQSFMQYEYKTARNNEFKMQKFTNDANKRIDQKLNTLSFSKEYTLYTTASLGKYDFNKNAFPINFDIGNIKDIARDLEGLFIGIGSIINKDDINFSVEMSADKAESLMSALQQSNGVTNRKLNLVMTYNVTKVKPHDKGSNGYENTDLNIYVSSIKVTTDGGARNQIAHIRPKEWEDRIKGIQNLNGLSTFQDGRWTFKVEYKNGKPVNPVKKYYKNGNLRMVANYEYFNNPSDYKIIDYSTISWYFDNGAVEVTAMYKDNKFHKERVEYYPSGNIKNIAYYTNGKKNGCFKTYNEDGTCKYPNIGYRSGKFFPFYKMGEVDYSNRSCNCDSPKAQFSPNSVNSNITNEETITSKPTTAIAEVFYPWAQLEEKPRTIQCSSARESERTVCIFDQLKKHVINNISKSTLEKAKATYPAPLFLSINVNKNGQIIRSRLSKNQIPELNNEINNALKTFPVLKGARVSNSAVNFNFSFPIKFN